MEDLTEKELTEVFSENVLRHGEIAIRTFGYVIDHLQYGQIALQIVENEHRSFEINDTNVIVPTYIFFDKEDGLLKTFYDGEKVKLYITKDDFEVKYIILDLEINEKGGN